MSQSGNSLRSKVCPHGERKLNGITLIALVITVIVLLILAGAAVSVGLNEDSLFDKAESAKLETNIKISDEGRTLNQGLGLLDEVTADVATVTTEEAQYPKDWDETKLSGVATTGLRTAPIPSGFVVSGVEGENTIAGGLVIYNIDDKTGEEIANIDWTNPSTVESLKTKYDQFVWIPVDDINQMVMCKDNNKDNDGSVCNLMLQSDGRLKCMTHHKNDDGTELCGRLYEFNSEYDTETVDEKTIYKQNIYFNSKSQIWDPTSYHEPNVLEDTTYGDSSENGLQGISDILNLEATATDYSSIEDDWKDELENNFKVMAESTAKYGGFYIGRYEAGYMPIPDNYSDTSNAAYTSYKGQAVMDASNRTNIGVNNWYELYRHLKGTKGATTSSMIWGCQYDQAIKFIGAEAQIGHADRNLPRTDTIASGTTEKDKMKNIYDLEGNYWEWTVSSYGTYQRARRGSYHLDTAYKVFRPASTAGKNWPILKSYRHRFSTNTLHLIIYDYN